MSSRYLRIDEITAHLSSVGYKPEWMFAVSEHPGEGWCIEIRFSVPNTYRIGEQQVQNVLVPIPPIIDEQHFHDWLDWRIKRLDGHERAEFYRVNGVMRHDPHAEPIPVA